MAASAYFDTVQKLYIAFYQRPADSAGLKYWAEQIDAANGNIDAAIQAFSTQEEAVELYGEIDETTIESVLDSIYFAAFGRSPEQEELDYWVPEFVAGRVTPSNIALAVVLGALGTDAATIDNKLVVANEFTTQVDGRPLTDPAFGTAPFAATYDGYDDVAAARDLLAGVTDDPDTILSPEDVTTAIVDTIADEGDAIIPVEPPPTFSLTADADSVDEGDTVTFTVEGGKANFTYNYELTGVDATDVEGGVLTGSVTTDADGNGTFEVTLAADRATDGADTLTATLPNTGLSASVTVNDTSLDNIAPVAVDATANAIEEGAVVTGQLEATDADDDALTFTLDAPLQGLTLNADGSYSFDPTQNDIVKALTTAGGSTDLVATYTVTDALGATDTGTLTITAAPAPLSFKLEVGATTVNEDGSITFTVTANEAVAAATDVVFTLKPGNSTAADQGTDTTNLNDFDQGAFNPVTKQIAAGGTSVTFTITAPNDNVTELAESFSVQAVVGGQTLTATATLLDGSTGAGKTYMLTKGLDNVAGTAGNDTIIGSIDNTASTELNTLSTIDIINGGAGVDTLKIAVAGSGTDVVFGNLSNVEIVEVESASSAATLVVNTTTTTGVTNLNVTKVLGALTATAAATTDVAVTVKENGAGTKLAHSVVGGKNVTVTASDMGVLPASNGSGDSITIGSGTVPKGDVVVNLTGAKYAGGSAAFGSGDTVVITGGKTVTVTQVASSDSSFAATSSGNSGSGVTQADVKVTANADTTTINVKQDVATAVNAKATTGGVTETATVKFGAMKAGSTLTLDLDGTGAGNSGITLTAKEDMTAADVAQAFANLVAKSNHLNASGTATLVDGDTQGGAAYTKGTYTNDTSASGVTGSGGDPSLWTSAAASADTVVFTAATATPVDVANLAFSGASGSSSVVPTVTQVSYTQGKAHDATFTGGVMGAIAGKVTIDGASSAALKTITVNGFGSGSNTSGTTALETLNLSNSAGNAFTVGNAAATLNLNLEKVSDASGSGSGVTISSGAATLNVKSVGNNVLTAADVTTALNVSGNGTLTGGASGGLDTIKTIVVTETAGLNFSAASSGLTALESVNTTATTGTVTINIAGTATYTGGAGKDIVTVTNAASTGIAKAIDLGAGDDTLILNGAGTTTPTVDIKGGDGVDTLSMTVGTASGLGAAYVAKISGFERLTLNDRADISGANLTVNLKTLGFANYVTTNGYSGGSGLILDNLADNATVVLTHASGTGSMGSGSIEAKIEGASGSTTNVLNVIGSASTYDLTLGKLVAKEVETINLTATDTAPLNSSGKADIQTITLALAADKATAVNLGTSNANLTLTLDATTNKLAMVDGATATGNLTVDLTKHNGVAMTIKGGAGADDLSASFGANAKADVLNGGAGNDILVAGTNGAKLTGGLGNDLFVVMDATDSGSGAGWKAVGNKEANTYTTIEDFQAGDVLQLLWNSDNGSGADGTSTGTIGPDAVVASFAKLTATLDAGTAGFTNYVTAAMQQAAATTAGTGGDAVWFKFGNDSYVVVDNGAETKGTFVNGEDLIVKLTGVDLTSASFNTTFGTVAL